MPFVLSTHEHNERGLILVLYVSLSLPPHLFNFLVQTDRYEALNLDQLQKSNRAGVTLYGMAPNELCIELPNLPPPQKRLIFHLWRSYFEDMNVYFS